jgi:hypothetical protein
MSNLIDGRNKMLLHLRIQDNDRVKEQISPSDVKKILEEDLSRCREIQVKIEMNAKEQQQLLQEISSEKESFDSALRSNSSMNQWQTIIEAIEEGLVAVSKATHQVEEGHNFYQSILPIITHLQQQASDLSVRMAVQRYEFQELEIDRERLRLQDIEDAKIAAKLTKDIEEEEMLRRDTELAAASSNNTAEAVTNCSTPNSSNRLVVCSNCSNPHIDTCSNSLKDSNSEDEIKASIADHSNAYALDFDSYQLSPSSSACSPAVSRASHFKQAQSLVDDELVAQLVAMDFNVESAVQALARYDNNIENAINDLLTESNK